MSAKANSDRSDIAPSVKERIKALYIHSRLFEVIAEYPQAGIHETFGREWALCLAYTEGEVHRCERAVEYFLRKNTQSGDPTPFEAEYNGVMNDLVRALLLHARVVKTFQKMSSSPPPSKRSMEKFRINSRVGESGMRAANGEMASMYGQEGEPIPYNLATVDDEDLSPIARFIYERLLDPLVEYVVTPSKDLLLKLPMYRRRFPVKEKDSRHWIFNTNTISAVVDTSAYVLAILILIALIAIFNVVEEQSLRIVIIPLFCLLLAASAQLMGSHAMPSFTLVVAYFQAMVFFVGNSNVG